MLELKNVTAGYNGVPVLHEISFRVADGENLVILGPNGCGKTTLLRTICNLLPFSGEIMIDGKSVKKMRRKEIARKVAMLSQITQVYFSYSVYETVLLGRYTYSPSHIFSSFSADDRRAAESALETVHMQDLRDREISTLSGGQLQRVFLAKILAQQPDIILLDEPTNHLDLSYQIELIEYLKLWSQQENKSIIGVLHDINLAMSLAGNILLLKEGRLTAFGDVSTALNPEVLHSTYQMDVVGYMVTALSRWSRFTSLSEA